MSDPDVPTRPSHITGQHTQLFTQDLPEGGPGGEGIIKTPIKGGMAGTSEA